MKSETAAYKRAAVLSVAVLACLALTVCMASASVADAGDVYDDATDVAGDGIAVSDLSNDDEFKDTGVSYGHAQLYALVIIVILLLAVAGVAHLYHYYGKE